jgi:hypothetical protein
MKTNPVPVLALAVAGEGGMNEPVQVHREEGRFTIRIELEAEFDEAYEGDEDGNAWLRQWQRDVRPRVARAVMEALREGGRYDAIPVSRGAAPDENFEVAVKLRLPSAKETRP